MFSKMELFVFSLNTYGRMKVDDMHVVCLEEQKSMNGELCEPQIHHIAFILQGMSDRVASAADEVLQWTQWVSLGTPRGLSRLLSVLEWFLACCRWRGLLWSFRRRGRYRRRRWGWGNTCRCRCRLVGGFWGWMWPMRWNRIVCMWKERKWLFRQKYFEDFQIALQSLWLSEI